MWRLLQNYYSRVSGSKLFQGSATFQALTVQFGGVLEQLLLVIGGTVECLSVTL